MDKQVPFSKGDQLAVLAHVGGVMPIVFREAIDDGFANFARSRKLDPTGFAEYGKCCRANMLYDRIVATARDLCDSLMPVMPDLRWRIGENERATEVLLGPYIVFRVKRIKKNRKELTTGVKTGRNSAIRSERCVPVGQMSMPFVNDLDFLPMVDRVWVTAAYDLDDVEESVSKVVMGVETQRRWIWRVPVQQSDAEVIGTLPTAFAGRIQEIRQRRIA